MKRGWFVLGLAAAAWVMALNSSQPLFYHLAYLISALFLLSAFWAWYNVLALRVTRKLSSTRSQVGKTIEERFSVRNLGPLPKLWVQVRDHSTLAGHLASRVLTALGPGRAERWHVRTWCQRRGEFTLGPITLISSDPFGIFHMRRQIAGETQLVVYPAALDLPYFPSLVGEHPGGDAMRRRTHYVTTNVAGVRDYAPGDSLNRIHWPSTARTGRLIAKEFELDPTADIWVFLDMDQEVHVSAAWTEEFFAKRSGPALLWERRPDLELPPATEEYAVTVAATLGRHYLRRGRAVGLAAYAETREILHADRGDRQLKKMLETLAVMTAAGRVPLAQMLSAEGAALGKGVAVVVVTPDPSTDWVAALRDFQRRGIRTLAVVIAADTFGQAPSHRLAATELEASGILTYVVEHGADLKTSLTRYGPTSRPVWNQRTVHVAR